MADVSPPGWDKPLLYYGHARTEILPLVRTPAGRVLEVGCAGGATLAWLRSHHGATWTAGVEFRPEVAELARPHLDAAWVGDVETLDLPIAAASLDHVLCLDVLEHLRDPWSVVRRLTTLLRPGGAFIASIPNVRNSSVVWPLLLRGRFDYQPEGLLDSTHLRFFTRATATELVACGGLAVDRVLSPVRQTKRGRLKNLLTLGLARELFDFQYLIRGLRPWETT